MGDNAGDIAIDTLGDVAIDTVELDSEPCELIIEDETNISPETYRARQDSNANMFQAGEDTTADKEDSNADAVKGRHAIRRLLSKLDDNTKIAARAEAERRARVRLEHEKVC